MSKKNKKEVWTKLEAAYVVQKQNLPEEFKEKEVWKNNLYTVFVRRGIETPFGNVVWLSIKRNDKEPAKNWRHFQYIKNQLVGPEHEGMEIYPAESRLVDGSNQYHMWVIERENYYLPFGFNEGRMVTEKALDGGKQEPFEIKPEDLKECEERVEREFQKFGITR